MPFDGAVKKESGSEKWWWLDLKNGDTVRLKSSVSILTVDLIDKDGAICKNIQNGESFLVKTEAFASLFELHEKAPVVEKGAEKLGYQGVFIGDMYKRDLNGTLHRVKEIDINKEGVWVYSEEFGSSCYCRKSIVDFKLEYTPVYFAEVSKSR